MTDENLLKDGDLDEIEMQSASENDAPSDDTDSSEPLDLAHVLTEELREAKTAFVSPHDLGDVFAALHDAKLAALCFSGGGIRSATFGLGIVQALARRGLLSKFDYLSTVSGGGYLGSWLSAWVRRARIPKKEDSEDAIPDRDLGIHRVQSIINRSPIRDFGNPNPEPPQLQHLREYSNYMSPRTGLMSADSWTLIAIYLRNLFLNLTIFLPLMAAVLILPRLLYRSVGQPNLGANVQLSLLIAAMALGAAAVAFVIGRLPSKNLSRDEEGAASETSTASDKVTAFANTDGGVLLLGVFPLAVSALLTTTLWAWTYRSVSSLGDFRFLSYTFEAGQYRTLIYFILATIVAFVFGVVLFQIFRFKRGFGFWEGIAAIASCVLGGILLWLITTKVFPRGGVVVARIFGEGSGLGWPIYFCLAVPTFLMIVLVCATVFVGFTSRRMTDEDREWLARYGAWVLIAAACWVGINAIVLLGPRILEWIFNIQPGEAPSFSGAAAIISTVATAVSGAISLVGGFSEKSKVRAEGRVSITSRILTIAPQVAATIFLLSIFILIAFGTTVLLYIVGRSMPIEGLAPFPASYEHAVVLSVAKFGYVLLFFVVLTAIGLIMACFVNVNKFSLHGAYRDRLVRAYLGASNVNRKKETFIGFDDNDNLELHELENQRPLHVINAAVNLVGGKNLAWQNRKAASFTMSPLHCGSWAVKGYRRSKKYCRSTTTGKALRLGTAMAISGAAANPNMGYYSSPVVTFLMSLFNIRLGWWLGNTGTRGSDFDWFGLGNSRYYEKVGPSIAVLPLINETFGRTDENKRFLMVTDGGHFENLALYEMVLRRCKLIILSDGAADADFKFGEIANAIQKCKVDLGVEIEFVGSMNIRGRLAVKEKASLPKSRFAIARITYPEIYDSEAIDAETGNPTVNRNNGTGWLIYTRPTYYETEPRDIRNYADSNTTFPHQSTGDQMYDEKQFEAYRGLGFLTMTEIVRILVATAKGDPENEVDDDLEELFANEVEMRQTLFEFFNLGDYDSYKPRKKRQKAATDQNGASSAPPVEATT
ncbi:MAG TPA: patatin-like phospholipase family protein [Pyrinomonadaceae bacterium]|nr:patatin-like phospholipase family protein [Pyrinomonadaceae bacterium]